MLNKLWDEPVKKNSTGQTEKTESNQTGSKANSGCKRCQRRGSRRNATVDEQTVASQELVSCIGRR
jgi:hypothetical protein